MNNYLEIEIASDNEDKGCYKIKSNNPRIKDVIWTELFLNKKHFILPTNIPPFIFDILQT